VVGEWRACHLLACQLSIVNCLLSIVNLGSFLFAFLFCFFLSVCIYISLFLLFPEEKRGRKKGGGERGRRGEVVDVDVVN